MAATVDPNHVHSLHRYFVWANRMYSRFNEVSTRTNGKLDTVKDEFDFTHYMSSWYGGLYVVIEGWQELGLSDPEVDALLMDIDKVGRLKRYRNGTFHFQRDYYGPRFFEFMEAEGSAEWIRALTEAFSKWFLAYTPS